MKLNQKQYNELVDKLADEIISEGMEVTAGVKDVARGAKEILTGARLKGNGAEGLVDLAKLKKEKAKTIAARTGVGLAGAGAVAGGVTGVNTVRKKEASDADDEQVKAIIEAKKEELANNDNKEVEEKAAAVYEYALRKIAACEEFYNDGVLGQQACIEVLAEAGLMDENGLNKEAAEQDEETAYVVNKIAEEYDEYMNKVAAAEECYEEAVGELKAAMEVLAELGYEFE